LCRDDHPDGGHHGVELALRDEQHRGRRRDVHHVGGQRALAVVPQQPRRVAAVSRCHGEWGHLQRIDLHHESSGGHQRDRAAARAGAVCRWRHRNRRLAGSLAPDGQRAHVAGRCHDRLCVSVADQLGRPARRAGRQLGQSEPQRREIPHRGGVAGPDRDDGTGGRERPRGARQTSLAAPMEFLGLTIARTRTLRETLSPVPSGAASRGSGGWIPVVREPSTGAWQQNVQISQEPPLSYYAVFACVTLISADIGKLRLRLVQQDDAGIWTETTNPAYSPVLRKPNRYQTIGQLVEQWVTSKLNRGNTFVLKERDQRGVVKGLYVLDPRRVTPLIATDGSSYYQLSRDDLNGPGVRDVTVPASEIIHDRMNALFHPLVGVTPLYACGMSAQQGLTIQSSSNLFFATGSRPGGTLIAPGAISDENAARLKAYWETNFSGQNVGKVAVLGDGLKYEPMTMSAVEAQLIDQLKWTAETICSAYHVPPYMVQIGPPPPYANVEPLVQQYYSQCLQSLITALEVSLDDGLELISPYGTEVDIDDLILVGMTRATRTKRAHEAISAGALSPNEARKKYFAVGPVLGGESPFLQNQYYSLAALAAREAAPPSGPAAPPPPPAPVPPEPDEVLATLTAIRTAAYREGLY